MTNLFHPTSVNKLEGNKCTRRTTTITSKRGRQNRNGNDLLFEVCVCVCDSAIVYDEATAARWRLGDTCGGSFASPTFFLRLYSSRRDDL